MQDLSVELESLGFAEKEAESILYSGDKEITEDAIPSVPKKPITKLGDVWVLGKHRILCGDSTQEASAKKVLNGLMAGAVITDPPYGVSYESKAGKVHNDDARGLRALLGNAFKLAITNSHMGAVWYVCAPPGPQFYDFASVLLDHGIWRQTLVWAKNSLVMGHSDYHYQHECIFYGWTPGAKHMSPPDRKQTSLWSYDRPSASPDHPTTKPVGLIAKMIGNSTSAGSIVYDPFLGSGTTLVAAEQCGRACYGIEIFPGYCDVIIERWEALTGGKAVRG